MSDDGKWKPRFEMETVRRYEVPPVLPVLFGTVGICCGIVAILLLLGSLL